MNEYDVLVIGGGTAGVAAALSAARQEARVGLIESSRPGGHSLFKGHIPLQVLRDPSETSDAIISLENLAQRAEEQAEKASRQVVEDLQNAGVERIPGEGSLAGNRQVMVLEEGNQTPLKAGKIIIATGSLTKPVNTIPFDDQSIFPLDRFLDWQKTPNSLLIVGGDKAGLEAAQIFSLLGARVFLVDEHSRLIHDQDPELITALEAGFKKQKIKVLLGKKIISIFKDKESIDVTLDGGVKFSTERILVSGARLGNTANLGLDSLNVEVGPGREIWVNEHMETSLAGVFAAGSVTGRSRSLQISEEEGRVAGINASGGHQPLQREHISFCLQTQPKIASIGCIVANAHYQGFRAVEGRYDSTETGNSTGSDGEFCRIIADRESKQIIGAQVSGAQAFECIALVQSNIKKGVSVKELVQNNEDQSPHLEPILKAAKKCARALSGRR